MNILVSACLIGLPTRYAGDGKNETWIEALAAAHTLIPVCPEQLGGLPTPRTPSERVGDKVMSKTGADCTQAFRSGAECALKAALLNRCTVAILKQRSPSCGSRQIYDGTFSGNVVPGQGITAELLKAHGITVFSEEDEAEALRYINH